MESEDASSSKKTQPFELESMETLLLLVFTGMAADRIWGRYLNRPSDMDAEVFGFALWAVNDDMVADAESSNVEWHSCIDRLRISESLKSAIMLKKYEDVT